MPRASQRLGEKKSGKWGVDSAARGGSGGEAFFHLDPKEKLSWWWLSNRYENCFSLFLVRDHSKRLLHSRRRNYIRRLGGAGKRGQGRQQQCPSVKHLNVGRSIFHSSGEKRSDGRKLIESFSLDGGAAEIFFFPFPPFSKIFSDFPPRIESHPLSRVCAGSATRKDVYSTEVQRLGSISRPNEISFTHTRSRRQIYPRRAQRHTHTHTRIK